MRSAIARAFWRWPKCCSRSAGVSVGLDEVARQAGVGAGTLYRHFPTRESLLEAVYRSEVEKLAAAEQQLAATLPPADALKAWMLLFVDYGRGQANHRAGFEYVGGKTLKVVRSLGHAHQGRDQRLGGARDRQRRYSHRS